VFQTFFVFLRPRTAIPHGFFRLPLSYKERPPSSKGDYGFVSDRPPFFPVARQKGRWVFALPSSFIRVWRWPWRTVGRFSFFLPLVAEKCPSLFSSPHVFFLPGAAHWPRSSFPLHRNKHNSTGRLFSSAQHHRTTFCPFTLSPSCLSEIDEQPAKKGISGSS